MRLLFNPSEKGKVEWDETFKFDEASQAHIEDVREHECLREIRFFSSSLSNRSHYSSAVLYLLPPFFLPFLYLYSVGM